MMISVMSMATKRKEASKGKYTSELLYREYFTYISELQLVTKLGV